MRYIQLLCGAATVALGMSFVAVPFVSVSFFSAAPAYAAPDPGCVRPDGAPCPPMPPGCVQDNGMPCSPAPQDLAAACARNPVVCMWLTR
jgi:hypothetical protein